MTLRRFDYIAPTTVGTAVTALREPGSVALAGGHHLLTQLKRRETNAARLVDLGGIRELRGVRSDAAGGLRVGALTTLGELLTDPLVRAAHGTGALHDAVSNLGDRQSRNRVTVGGQLACSRTGNDLGAALMVLGTVVHLARPGCNRAVALPNLWDADGRLSLRPGELITGVQLEPVAGTSGYARMTDRANLEAVCGVAVLVPGDDTGRCRVAVVGATVRPGRLAAFEEFLLTAGSRGLALPVDVPFLDDAVASAEYRRHMTRVLADRAVDLARGRRPVPTGGKGTTIISTSDERGTDA